MHTKHSKHIQTHTHALNTYAHICTHIHTHYYYTHAPKKRNILIKRVHTHINMDTKHIHKL